jgi:hypothetical protein
MINQTLLLDVLKINPTLWLGLFVAGSIDYLKNFVGCIDNQSTILVGCN